MGTCDIMSALEWWNWKYVLSALSGAASGTPDWPHGPESSSAPFGTSAVLQRFTAMWNT
jgi:hypothetical protein